jgi:DNA-binding MarR family transcriptional regulator
MDPAPGDALTDVARSRFPSRFATPAASPGFLLWRATLAWQRALRAALEPLGLTHVQFVLLAVAGWHAAEIVEPSQAQVGRVAGTDPMMTSQVLRTLEARGLVTRAARGGDRRARGVALTGAGEALLARALPVVEDADEAFFARADGHAALLRGLLASLAEVPRPDGGR